MNNLLEQLAKTFKPTEMTKGMTIQEIHTAIDNGKEVNWSNPLYKVHEVQAEENNEYAKLSYRDGKALRVTCKSNYFGALISIEDLKECYITN